MSIKSTKRIVWLDVAKFFAIFAVMIDHTKGFLYCNNNIANGSYFSVSLFILIVGITSYVSFSDSNKAFRGWVKPFCDKTKGIILAYLLATIVYSIATDKGFVFLNIVNRLVFFNASAPLYYVLLYIGIMLVAYPLYKLIAMCEKSFFGFIKELCIFIAVIVFSIITTNHSDILGVYGGGGKLFGGTYLIMFTLGIIFAKHLINKVFSTVTYIIFLLTGIVGYSLWLTVICSLGHDRIDSLFPFGEGLNPPSISYMLLAIFVLIFVWGFSDLLQKNSHLRCVLTPLQFVGQHTLYIFLYHMLFLLIIKKLPISNIWVLRTICYSILIVGPILLEFIVNKGVLLLTNLCKQTPALKQGDNNVK